MTVQSKAPESQFAYVVLAARRARQVMAGAPPLLENPRTQKATRVACDELDHGLLEFDVPEATSVDEDKDGNKRKKSRPAGKRNANYFGSHGRRCGLQSRRTRAPPPTGRTQCAGGHDAQRARVCHPPYVCCFERAESYHGSL